MIMLQLVKNQRDARHTQQYGLSKHSLEPRVMQQIEYTAHNKKIKLMTWMTRQKIEAIAEFLRPDLSSITDLQYEKTTEDEYSCQVDMYGILRGILKKMNGTVPFKNWPEEAENKLK
jgi:hypothetical protein